MLKKMTLKHILPLLVILATVGGIASCGDNDEIVSTEASKDARIFSFSLVTGERQNAIDTIAYDVLDKTKFAIIDGLIYNPDSLPVGTRIATFKMNMGFNKTPSGVRIINKVEKEGGGFEENKLDSLWWNNTDSVDFAKLDHFMIVPPSAKSDKGRNYWIEFRIHTVDPDSVLWGKSAEQFPVLGYTADKIQAILKGDDFYCYSISDATARLSTFSKSSKKWTNQTLSGFPSSARLESVTLLNDKFYAIDAAGKAYWSANGTTWAAESNSLSVHSVLGILPEGNKMLTVVNKDNVKRFATTSDMKNFEIQTVKGSGGAANDVPKDFLSHGFTSVVEAKTEKSIFITGGTSLDGGLKNVTWALAQRNNELEVTKMTDFQENKTVNPNKNIATFAYDDKLYAVNDSVFATSGSWGYKWNVAPKKQILPAKMGGGLGQSVIVDKATNYIWMFGRDTNGKVAVWRGRLTRLEPKNK